MLAVVGAAVSLAMKVLGGPGWVLVAGKTTLALGVLVVVSCVMYMRMTGPTLVQETPPPYLPKTP